MDESAGTGEGYDAMIIAEDNVGAVPDEEAAAARELTDAMEAVEAAQAKVDKQRAHLAGAEQALADAQARLAEIQGA